MKHDAGYSGAGGAIDISSILINIRLATLPLNTHLV